jgi:hypothetical protein
MDNALLQDLQKNLDKKTCDVCKKTFKFHRDVVGITDEEEFYFDGFIDQSKAFNGSWVHYLCKDEHYKKNELVIPLNGRKEMQLTLNEILHLPKD